MRVFKDDGIPTRSGIILIIVLFALAPFVVYTWFWLIGQYLNYLFS